MSQLNGLITLLLPIMFVLFLQSQSTQPHLLYLPHPGHDKGNLVERAVGLLYCLPLWNVSIRIDGDLVNQDVAAQVRSSTSSTETIKLRQPFLTAQCHALKSGLAVTKKMKPREDVDAEPTPDEQTQEEIRAGRQSVLSKAAPAAKVVLNVPKPKAVSSSSVPQTRAATTSEMDIALEMEKQSQDRATARAKRQRQEDEAKAAAAAPAKKTTRGSGLKPPRKEAKGRVGDAASEDDQ